MRGDMADEARDSISSEEVRTLQSLASCNLKNIEVKSFQQHLTLEKKFSTTSNTGEKVVKQVTVGHWGNVMPPVIRGNLVPSNAVTAIQVQKAFSKMTDFETVQRSQSQPSRLAQVPSPPLPPDPPPLYEEVLVLAYLAPVFFFIC